MYDVTSKLKIATKNEVELSQSFILLKRSNIRRKCIACHQLTQFNVYGWLRSGVDDVSLQNTFEVCVTDLLLVEVICKISVDRVSSDE